MKNKLLNSLIITLVSLSLISCGKEEKKDEVLSAQKSVEEKYTEELFDQIFQSDNVDLEATLEEAQKLNEPNTVQFLKKQLALKAEKKAATVESADLDEALTEAIKSEEVGMVLALLQKGAKVSEENIQAAITTDNYAILEELLKKDSASIANNKQSNILDSIGFTLHNTNSLVSIGTRRNDTNIIRIALTHATQEEIMSAIALATVENKIDALEFLLNNTHEDLSTHNNFSLGMNSILLMSAALENPEAATLLAQYGANPQELYNIIHNSLDDTEERENILLLFLDLEAKTEQQAESLISKIEKNAKIDSQASRFLEKHFDVK